MLRSHVFIEDVCDHFCGAKDCQLIVITLIIFSSLFFSTMEAHGTRFRKDFVGDTPSS